MNERIQSHVDAIFSDAPDTLKVRDLKEELLSNLSLKYEDLIAGGDVAGRCLPTSCRKYRRRIRTFAANSE